MEDANKKEEKVIQQRTIAIGHDTKVGAEQHHEEDEDAGASAPTSSAAATAAASRQRSTSEEEQDKNDELKPSSSAQQEVASSFAASAASGEGISLEEYHRQRIQAEALTITDEQAEEHYKRMLRAKNSAKVRRWRERKKQTKLSDEERLKKAQEENDELWKERRDLTERLFNLNSSIAAAHGRRANSLRRQQAALESIAMSRRQQQRPDIPAAEPGLEGGVPFGQLSVQTSSGGPLEGRLEQKQDQEDTTHDEQLRHRLVMAYLQQQAAAAAIEEQPSQGVQTRQADSSVASAPGRNLKDPDGAQGQKRQRKKKKKR